MFISSLQNYIKLCKTCENKGSYYFQLQWLLVKLIQEGYRQKKSKLFSLTEKSLTSMHKAKPKPNGIIFF